MSPATAEQRALWAQDAPWCRDEWAERLVVKVTQMQRMRRKPPTGGTTTPLDDWHSDTAKQLLTNHNTPTELRDDGISDLLG